MAFSSLNINCPRAFVSSVFPTPVGPKKMKLPMGLFGSPIPARERLITSDTREMASSCPITRFFNSISIFSSFARSSSNILVSGIPVQRATTSAISSAVISSFKILRDFCNFFNRRSFTSKSFFKAGIFP